MKSQSKLIRSRRSNFDPVARLYRWGEYLLLGPLLTRTRNRFLPEMLNARHALVLGDGDGRFLMQLLRRALDLSADAVDTSAAMLRLVRTRCAFAGPRLQTRQASALALPEDLDLGSVDLIITHFFLDCLSQTELETLADHLTRTVRPNCLWVVSDFGIPRRHPWDLLARIYVRGLYLAFRLLTGLQTQSLPDIAGALTRAGFRHRLRVERLQGFLYSDLWQLAPGNDARH